MKKPRLLTKLERAQLERARVLLEKIHEESCKALGVSSDDSLDEPIAAPAKYAEVSVYELLDQDQQERERWKWHRVLTGASI